ncbi:amino acid ABC transporter ATP-binding protein [Acinetobacter sp. B5B]|uniref:amino acid ABC transporter ATP-binding protein n=1 Tax=Acinetobacter baretiae TaxID=2605383 RepID=UPI0018C1F166|nr:amino acid ABC transporter ATP-binding protein [Acinetobacter baretiae]MBF7681797.1 amino acid ABC transporter ATP-binding protein [Acinetobacter baretiae]MBF7685409.1 amino acid ABC transporter ATP-binding protein [Acinetobacter baretiae]
MISVKHLCKRFGEHTVLNGIDLTVNNGEVVAIIGPSGSGKSTLLRCLNLLEVPQSGQISIGQVVLDYAHYDAKEAYALRRKSAMVFQNYSLFKNKTTLENVTEVLKVVKKIKKDQIQPLAMQYLAKVGMADFASQYPVTLSGGQQQRVGIARAMAVDPDVILFDEPTSALDPERVNEVLHVIQNLAQQKTTMIIVTHEMEFARHVADRIIFMMDGQIVEQGTPQQIFDESTHPKTQKFLRKIMTYDQD